MASQAPAPSPASKQIRKPRLNLEAYLVRAELMMEKCEKGDRYGNIDDGIMHVKMAAALVQERWAALERLRQAGGIGSDVELELKRLELHEEAGLLHSAEANRRRAQIEDGGVRLPLLLLLFIAFARSLLR